MKRSPTSGWEPAPGHATQRAAWEALGRSLMDSVTSADAPLGCVALCTTPKSLAGDEMNTSLVLALLLWRSLCLSRSANWSPNPDRFNAQSVMVRGRIAVFREGTTERGARYYTFDLTDGAETVLVIPLVEAAVSGWGGGRSWASLSGGSGWLLLGRNHSSEDPLPQRTGPQSTRTMSAGFYATTNSSEGSEGARRRAWLRRLAVRRSPPASSSSTRIEGSAVRR
jgi:hypothetical protein